MFAVTKENELFAFFCVNNDGDRVFDIGLGMRTDLTDEVVI
jgi:[ribosomal protein S18]-alanine N-acetyltransferase